MNLLVSVFSSLIDPQKIVIFPHSLKKIFAHLNIYATTAKKYWYLYSNKRLVIGLETNCQDCYHISNKDMISIITILIENMIQI